MAHEKKKSSWELERETRQAPEGGSSEFRQKKEEILLGWHLWSPQKKGLKAFILSLDSVKREGALLSLL